MHCPCVKGTNCDNSPTLRGGYERSQSQLGRSWWHNIQRDALLNTRLGGPTVYRSEHRPDGDQSAIIDSMSGISVTTSLAAAIAEYHQHMMKKRGIYDRSKARKSGAPMQNLHISKSAARMLRILLFNRQSLGGDIGENG